MIQYKELVQNVLEYGNYTIDRTGVGTLSTFGEKMTFDLNDGFPALTLKKLAWKSVVSELLWFLEGSDNERRLAEIHYQKPKEELIGKKTIWTANADKQGQDLGYRNNDLVKELGPVYGAQWRNWYNGQFDERHDQILNLIDSLKYDPYSRRHILTAWNVGEIDDMALPPCHMMCQFYVREGKLSCQLYQRSADIFLGIPFNIASYALLTHILAKIVGLGVGKFVHVIGDAHIYTNHVDQCIHMLELDSYDLPKLALPEFNCIEKVIGKSPDDFKLENYESHPHLFGEMAT